MKKIWLLTTLLVCGLLLSGCNNSCTDDCLPDDWENTDQIQCSDVYDPICWEDWKVYSNWCYLNVAGVHWDETLWVKNNECFKITKESLYWEYILTRYNDNNNVRDNHNIKLSISSNWIFAKFCNDLWASNFDLSWNVLSVEEQAQTEIACEWENWEWLMKAENEFNLNDARVSISEDNLTISTSKWAQYQFQRNDQDQNWNTAEESEESIENNEDVALCNDIDIDWNTEIINIDDVVENCTYEEWTAYSWNDWWCWWVMPHLYITKDIIWYFDIVADEDHPIICKSPRAWIIKSLSGDFEDLATFWYKRGISKKSLIDVLEARTEEEVFQNGCWFYFCNGDICNQFYRPSYWENEHHYYIYWYRYPKEFPYGTVVLVDDKLYNIWSNETMFDDSYWPNPIKQWKWIVYWLDWDKLIVKRYVDWELIPPYTLENFNSYNFDEPTTTTKFKVKTCEIPL